MAITVANASGGYNNPNTEYKTNLTGGHIQKSWNISIEEMEKHFDFNKQEDANDEVGYVTMNAMLPISSYCVKWLSLKLT